MTRRSKFWFVAASVFTFVNLAGGVQAAAAGEGLHTAAHVGLLIVGAYFVWLIVRITNRGFRMASPAFLRNKRSVIVLICAVALIAGSLVDRRHPALAIVLVMVGFSAALTVARLWR